MFLPVIVYVCMYQSNIETNKSFTTKIEQTLTSVLRRKFVYRIHIIKIPISFT